MFVIIIYDIPDDKRRARLHKALKAFGEPVQFSAFEAILDESKLTALQKRVAKIIQEEEDRVRYYFLCKECCKRISGTKEHPTVQHLVRKII